jgi:hypothetical protein
LAYSRLNLVFHEDLLVFSKSKKSLNCTHTDIVTYVDGRKGQRES